jgi:hypothetical protein
MISRQRLYAGLLFLGACILLYRTVTMIVQGNLGILQPWVSVLLLAEFSVDLGCAVFAVRWWISNDSSRDSIPLRFGTAAALLHATHDTRWNMGEVYFASVMSILGVMGVLIIWHHRRRVRKKM